MGGSAELFVRLFKPVTAVQLLRNPRGSDSESAPEICFQRLPIWLPWKYRVVEQFHIFRRTVNAKQAASPHDRPRRLWGWSGLQAFPVMLPATGQSSYDLWRSVVRRDEVDETRLRLPEPQPFCTRQESWSGRTTVIIPTRNGAELLQRCVESILTRTRRQPPEIIICDNCSNEEATLKLLDSYERRGGIRVLRDELPFNFSRINNDAAATATREILIFLNNDTEVLSEDWIDRLGEIAHEPSVGCVGPLLLSPSGKIQHAGLVTGPGGIAAHLYAGLRLDEADPLVPIVQRDVSAVTGACLAIQRTNFLAIGGFDAEHLPVSFNDVDLCLRLERKGLRNVFLPDVRLMHVESATRENDDFITGSQRFRAEFRVMRERWGPRLDSDPYFPRDMRVVRSGVQLRLA